MPIFNLVGGGEKDQYLVTIGKFSVYQEESVTLYASKSNVEIVGIYIYPTSTGTAPHPIFAYWYDGSSAGLIYNAGSTIEYASPSNPTINGGTATVPTATYTYFAGNCTYYLICKNT